MTAIVEPAWSLVPHERERYSRQIILPGMGESAQSRLRSARVLVIGAGGLGAPALMGLAAAGIGTLGIVDADRVEPSNLQRQLLHGVSDIGRLKTESARDGVGRMNPDVVVETHSVRLVADNASELFSGYDLVIDGSDNFATRYLVDEAAAAAGVPVVWGSVLRYEGQVSVFWAARGARYRDLFPDVPSGALDCATAGVFGPLCAIIGNQMAAEAIKLITGTGRPLLGRLAIVDALTATWREIVLRPPSVVASAPGIITASALREEIAGEHSPLVIDVRAPDEPGRITPSVRWESGDIEAGFAPPREVAHAVETGRSIVVFCAAGVRSERAAMVLSERFTATPIRSLMGGIAAWGEHSASCRVS
ncbi:ThiF family adenylyltransferase [Microbacterium amylolyticum]|uniref:Adenylyltransferase/sulfurtransferase n=1 Tax=Microbacterium amylolyticum TaxID=936337 RepID=A0ABS4ZGA7_9MICO|nr:ThiF family adenylyltransferase [Microbacterium amylolyticum]MBP2436318.1 adenylyltransferase/sulfurtransferase [Microbacterium amylolyticum]